VPGQDQHELAAPARVRQLLHQHPGGGQKPVCDVFAQSGIDKFAALPGTRGSPAHPVLEGVLAYVDCDLEAEHDAGDHTVVLGRVRDVRILDPEGSPLLFFRGAYGRFSPLEERA
jgi:3-hydroxy-9,10-secoandrosta-1,3,5(10)-triene-9,17-dione monooxygenase reductase component